MGLYELNEWLPKFRKLPDEEQLRLQKIKMGKLDNLWGYPKELIEVSFYKGITIIVDDRRVWVEDNATLNYYLKKGRIQAWYLN